MVLIYYAPKGASCDPELARAQAGTLCLRLLKIGAKVVLHGCYVTFQLAEVAIPKPLFTESLRLIDRLWPAPLPP